MMMRLVALCLVAGAAHGQTGDVAPPPPADTTDAWMDELSLGDIGSIGDAVGRPSTLEGRFAYWCLADLYRKVAAETSGNVATGAARAADGYERAGPSREQYFPKGYSVTGKL